MNNVFSSLGNGSTVNTIEELCTVVNGYSFSSKDFSPNNEIKTIKITNVGVKIFVETDASYLPEGFADDFKDFRVKENSIVMALTRTIISDGLKVAVVPKSYDGALLNQRVAALIAKEKAIVSRYLYMFLCTKIVEDYVLANVNTLMQPNLSINDLKLLPVPVPSISEQHAIIEKIGGVYEKTKQLETIYQQKLEDLEELKKSILQKAFNGELKG